MDEIGLELVRLRQQSGKGTAVSAGIDRARLRRRRRARHRRGRPAPAGRDPGLRRGRRERGARDRRPLRRPRADAAPPHREPRDRRFFQIATGREVRDTQNGMRLLRGRALDLLPTGGWRSGDDPPAPRAPRRAAVAWTPIPAIYGEENSSFRPGRDSAKVLWALVRPLGQSNQQRIRAGLRWRYPRSRPWRSGRRGTRATLQPALQARAAAA